MTGAGLRPFGARLAAAMAEHGPLCVGIDPHPQLLRAWGLDDDAAGLARFSHTVVEALAGHVAAVKPQSAFFERHGSAGVAVLEAVVAHCRDAAVLCIVDAKRGDIGSTMAAYADAYAAAGSTLAGDAVTASPFLGFGSLRPLLDVADANGRGVFVLALTSNPEGGQVQHALTADGRSVAQSVLDAVAEENRGATPLGSVGVVVGATIGDAAAQRHDLSAVNGPFLAPGIGAQGAGARELRSVFGARVDAVLASSSREVLAAGPGTAALRAAAERTVADVHEALAHGR